MCFLMNQAMCLITTGYKAIRTRSYCDASEILSFLSMEKKNQFCFERAMPSFGASTLVA